MIKRLRDIKTHGTLDREGRLVSVARNLSGGLRSCNQTRTADLGSWDGSAPHAYRKAPTRIAPKVVIVPHREFQLEKRVREFLTEKTRCLLEEFYTAIAEGLPVNPYEFERLKNTLDRLQTE